MQGESLTRKEMNMWERLFDGHRDRTAGNGTTGPILVSEAKTSADDQSLYVMIQFKCVRQVQLSTEAQ